MTQRSTVEELDDLSRTRSLTDHEAQRLYKALNQRRRKNERWYWTKAEDRRLVRYLHRGRKPKMIAILMNRSEMAIWTRMKLLRLSARKIAATKSPMASDGGERG